MRAFYATVALAAVSSVSAFPLQKRIAQVIAESTSKWEQACLAAGGAEQCNPLSVAAFTTLLAAAGPCDQQNAADNMMDLAKQLTNNSEMIRLTQLFTQQPRNSPDSLSVLYCQNNPRNHELDGLFQCQFQGVSDSTFGSAANRIALGQSGTFPLGHSSALSPPGSCPANPGGKVPAGTQLDDLVSDPGVGSSGGSGGSGSGSDPATTTTTTAAAEATSTTVAAAPPVQSSSISSNTDTGSSGFQLSNAQQAQSQNIQFKSLSTSSSCTAGDVACIIVDGQSQFAECTSQGFVVLGCGAGTQCMALPLVNSVGTSVTCDTLDDAAIRFAGVQGGFDGSH